MSKSTKKKTNSSDIALKVEHVSKSFRLPTEKANGIKQAFINRMHGKTGYTKQEVLKDISFEINKGDFFGIVGRNGSGKSTLLKLISQIYTPDSGRITVNGSLVPFIELGVGFNPELTGRENVYLNGAMLGFSQKEVDEMYDGIVEFAELHEFMDQKLKNYSSGMQVRLAFSVAIKAQGDILVLDEVLAVGDEAFQRKCSDFFRDIKQDKSKTVILVTHSMEDVRQFCNKAMMIKDGEVVVCGSPEDVANEYSIENLKVPLGADYNNKQSDNPKFIEALRVEVLSKKLITQDDNLKIKVSYETLTEEPTKIRLTLRDIDREVSIVASSTKPINGKSVSRIFKINLGSINNSKLKIQTSIRNSNDDVLGFLPDSEAPSIITHRTDYPDPTKPQSYAVLFNRGRWE